MTRSAGSAGSQQQEIEALRARVRELEQVDAERRRAEEVLRISEAKISGIISIASDAIISIDESHRIVLFNHGAEEIFGYAASEVLGRPLDILLPDRFRAIHGEHIRRFAGSPAVARRMGERQEIVGRRKTGEEFPAEASISRLEVEGAWLFTVVLRDITEQKRAEEERRHLLMAEQLARAEAEAASAMVRRLQSVTDVALQHLALEDLLSELLGRIRESLDAETAGIFLITEDGRHLVARASHGVELVSGGENRIPIGRGVSGRVAVTRSPMIVDDLSEEEQISPVLWRQGVKSIVAAPLLVEGRIIGVVHVGARRPHHFGTDDMRLLELVADRIALAIDHARLYQEAQEAVRIRDEVLAFTSHDLKNLVASIRLRVQLLMSMLEAGTQEPLQSVRELSNVEAVARKMMGLIEELLDVARLQLGQPLPLDPRPTDLIALTQDMLEERRKMAKKHQFNLDATEPALVGWWDTERLERVLGNLLDNSEKYSPGGGSIDICVRREESKWAVLTVRDSGVGIPAADLPRIFERFRRGSNVVGRIKGTGIGLSGSRQIVEQHGGSVDIESKEGLGTAVTVRLPLPAKG